MKKRGRTAFIVSFLAPAVLLYALFVVWPVLQAFRYSLYQWRGASTTKTFVGLDNFTRLLKDPVFWIALKNNLYILVVSGIVLLALALLIAHGLQGSSRLVRGLRGVYLFPHMISLVVVSILWMFIYNPSFGLLNGTLTALGLKNWVTPWLGDGNTALPAVTATFIWYSLGFYIMVLAAGIKGVPQDVYEAATLDGAHGWRRFREVTLPLLWAVMRVSVVYLVIHAVNVFAIVFLMTEGGQPDRKTEVVLTYLYELAFQQSDFGGGTALAVLDLIIVMALSLLVLRIYRRDPTEARA